MLWFFYFILFFSLKDFKFINLNFPHIPQKRQYVLLYNHSTLINQFFQLILFLSVLISILQNFIIYFQLHSPKLLYFLPIIASFWEIIKCVGIIILLSFFLSLQQLHRPFHRSFRAQENSSISRRSHAFLPASYTAPGFSYCIAYNGRIRAYKDPGDPLWKEASLRHNQ